MGKDALSTMNKGNHPRHISIGTFYETALGPDFVGSEYEKARDLRYGTNPSQTAALYNSNSFLGSLQELRTGKEGPSQTNFEDIFYAAITLGYFNASSAIIMKHENPSGFATQYTDEPLARIYAKAFDADFRAAFGGTVMLNRPVDHDTASEIRRLFTEVVVAPDFDEGVVGSFTGSTRIYKYDDERFKSIPRYTGDNAVPEIKRLPDGSVIVADPLVTPIRSLDDLRQYIKSERQPTERELQDLLTGYRIRLRSNSIRMVKDGYTTGIGTGQMDRVNCINIAAFKNQDLNTLAAAEGRARAANYDIAGSCLISDGFFPFSDSIDRAHELGIPAVLAPHGGVKFNDVLAKVNEYGMAFVDLLGNLRFFDHH
ncbi:MAG TPA: IMP cyclohydrolase [archaeon]|nr:IMP cyclohydrolase [archaeon]